MWIYYILKGLTLNQVKNLLGCGVEKVKKAIEIKYKENEKPFSTGGKMGF